MCRYLEKGWGSDASSVLEHRLLPQEVPRLGILVHCYIKLVEEERNSKGLDLGDGLHHVSGSTFGWISETL